MQLSYKQEQGLKIAIDRYRQGQRYTVIGGFAGSGKSTLVRFIVAALGADEEDICYATFTGKAAQVLLKKGNKNVSTLHKLLYKSYPLPNGVYKHEPKATLDYNIIIVDECSMAPAPLVKLLLSHPVYVIFLGDPGQLPPINPEDDNHLLDKPHIFLDEIHRQAQESEIIRLSMDIREGKPLKPFCGQDVKIFRPEELSTGMLTWADQILCATNSTRVSLNNSMRELLGRSGGPQDGDKVICLRNYWETLSSNQDPLVNGTIGYLQNCYNSFTTYPYYIDGGGRFDVISAEFLPDTGGVFSSMKMDKKLITEGVESLEWRVKYQLSRSFKTKHLVPYEFTYGYAITTHKAQGSSWPNVLVVEERFPFSKEDHKRWLYTACTRPEEKLVLITRE